MGMPSLRFTSRERAELVRCWLWPRSQGDGTLRGGRMMRADEERWGVKPGDSIRHETTDLDWWEYVIGFGPDGRLVTADPRNTLHRYSDPTDRWDRCVRREG